MDIQKSNMVEAMIFQKSDNERVRSLQPLLDATELMLAETSPEKLGNLIIDSVIGLLKASFVCVYQIKYLGHGSQNARVLACFPAKECDARDEMMSWLNDWPDTPVVLNAGGASSPPGALSMLERAGLGTLLVAPVVRACHLIFCAGRGTAAPLFAEADLELFLILVRQAALALENARLYSELNEALESIARANAQQEASAQMAREYRLLLVGGRGERLPGGAVLTWDRRQISWQDGSLSLTPTEVRLLKILFERKNELIPHAELVFLIQGYRIETEEAARILRPLVSRLKQKLTNVPEWGERIKNVRGAGYVLELH